jgi:hypothetical protein
MREKDAGRAATRPISGPVSARQKLGSGRRACAQDPPQRANAAEATWFIAAWTTASDVMPK